VNCADVRCQSCKRLLMRLGSQFVIARPLVIQIVCPRCKEMNIIHATTVQQPSGSPEAELVVKSLHNRR
jgi:phage FluMu protein Com